MEEKKCGAWAITVKAKPPAVRRRGVDEGIKGAVRRDECRRARRKIIKYIK